MEVTVMLPVVILYIPEIHQVKLPVVIFYFVLVIEYYRLLGLDLDRVRRILPLDFLFPPTAAAAQVCKRIYHTCII